MSKINLLAVFKVIGHLLCLESLFMLCPLIVSFIYAEGDWIAFAAAILITFTAGFLMSFTCKGEEKHIGKREGFMIVATSWIFFSLFGMLPFLISGYIDNVTDAFFETISGFTTTGSSVVNDIEAFPHGLLFWRGMIQWLGGMGIILFTLAILPSLNSGSGIQMFNAEVTGIKHSKLRPRISQTAKRLWGVYLILTLILILLLYAGPMNLFDSVCHAFSTMATGGYSTKQTSIAYWNSPYTEYVIIIFMILSSINFSLIYLAALGEVKELLRDEETHWYLSIIGIAVAFIFISFYIAGTGSGIESTFRVSLFQVASLISTTGFATADYNHWNSFACFVLLTIMIFGGCAASTGGGIKIIRLIVFAKNTKNELYRHAHPCAVLPVRVNNHVISSGLVTKALGFLSVYFTLVVIASLIFSSQGYTIEESIFACVSAIGDVGPGIGALGPNENFSGVSDIGKWTLSFLMLTGRLELFTILILFTPYFWKK